MRKYALAAFGALLIASFAAVGQQESAPAGRTLKLKMNYTGTGTVDEKHKIFVFVFDTPDFMNGDAMPIAFGDASTKDGAIGVSGLAVSPVYVVAAYDPSGDYDGMSGPPPSGASVTIYSKTPPTPEPIKIEPGGTAEIEVAFDDSQKMP